jgi:hypothetical protein
MNPNIRNGRWGLVYAQNGVQIVTILIVVKVVVAAGPTILETDYCVAKSVILGGRSRV